jgi:hypothetical protein
VPTGCENYASAEAELAARVDVLGWAAGDGPKVIFADAVTWLVTRVRADLTGRRFSSRIRHERFSPRLPGLGRRP